MSGSPSKRNSRNSDQAVTVLSLRCRDCASAFVFTKEPVSADEQTSAACRCGRSIEVIDSLFVVDSAPFRQCHRINSETIGAFLARCQSIGWSRAFYELQRSLQHDAEQFFYSTLSPRYAAWKWVLPMTKNAKILVIGARQEAIALSLAPHGAEVVVVDCCRDRLLTTMYAAKGLSLNVTCVETDSLVDLPFDTASFDAAVIPDVQDMQRYFASSNERGIALDTLQALHQLLQKQGVLFIAGDNRFTYAGVTPDESVDRSQKTKLRRGRKSSTSTNSFRGYQVKLREAGFYPKEVFAPIPHHRAAQELIPLSGESRAMKNANHEVSRFVKDRIALHPQFLKAFGHSFAVRATVNERGGYSFLEEVLLRIEWQARLPPLVLDHLAFGEEETLVYCSTKDMALLLRIPHTPQVERRTLRNADCLKHLSHTSPSNSLRSLLPIWVHTSTQEGVCITAETRPTGAPLSIYHKELHLAVYREEILRVLLSLSALRTSGSRAALPLLKEMSDFSEQRLLDPRVRQGFVEVSRDILARVKVLDIPGVLVHGNITLATVYWDASQGEISGLIDWHSCLDRGLPGWDCISLEVSIVKMRFGCSTAEAILWLLEQGNAPAFDQIWNRYASSLNISSTARATLLCSFWIMYIWRSLSFGYTALHYSWLRRNVISFIEHYQDNLQEA